MIYFNAFLLPGIVCMVGQIILDNTKLTAGHVTTFFTVLGSFLSFLDIYPWLIKKAGAGATILISNFGNMLFEGGMEGYYTQGFWGIFSGLLCKGSFAISVAIVSAFILTIFFKPKD